MLKRLKINIFIVFALFLSAEICLAFSCSNVQTKIISNESNLPEKEAMPENLPALGYCDLVEDPQKYDGKIVRLNAVLKFGIEAAWFSDEKNCGVNNGAVVEMKDKKVQEKLGQARNQKNRKYMINDLKLVVTGRFKDIKYSEGGLEAPYQFEIIELENVSLP